MSSSGAHRQRYTHSPKPSPTFPRYQLTHSHGQPEGGGGKSGGGRVLHCCHPRCPRSGTINIIILGRSSIGQRAETGNTDQTIPSLKNKQAQIKEFPTEIQQTRGRGKTQKRNSTKLHKTTKLHVSRMKRINDKTTRLSKKKKKEKKKKDLPKWRFSTLCCISKILIFMMEREGILSVTPLKRSH